MQVRTVGSEVRVRTLKIEKDRAEKTLPLLELLARCQPEFEPYGVAAKALGDILKAWGDEPTGK